MGRSHDDVREDDGMSERPRLGVIVASVRGGRVGAPVSDWFVEQAERHGGFDVERVDLQAVDLPLLSEPNHPRLQKYTHEKTKAWSRTIDSLDAFVLVTPEYNYSSPPALINALDHLYHEWSYKAVGLVSYGGISGGLRGAQVTRQFLCSFKMVPIVEAVAIPFVVKQIENGRFTGGASYDASAKAMLDELVRWTSALRVLRTP
jgi:NAD(P)H-dependent FMN reductase